MKRPGGRLAADVKRLAKGLGPLPGCTPTPALIVLVGLPGTGKSFFSARLAQRMEAAILESDALRKALFSSPSYSWEESAYLFSVIHKLIEQLLRQGMSVILDATNLAESAREHLYEIAERCKARLILVRTTAPPGLVHARLDGRGATHASRSDADWSVYQKMAHGVERIRRPHFTVDTSRDIEPVINRVVESVLLAPEPSRA
jgi:predicted kinase